MTVAGLELTDRDRAIFTFLAKNRIATVQEIEARFWSQKLGNHHYERLLRLSDAGYLTRVTGDRGAKLGYSLSIKGYATATEEDAAASDRGRLPVYRTAFDHDVIVRELIRALELAGKLERYVSETELRRSLGYRATREAARKVPDAILTLAGINGLVNLALEVELAPKARARYREMAQRLRFLRGVEGVLVVFARDYAPRAIGHFVEQARSRDVKLGRTARDNRFYFLSLAAFRSKGIDGQFLGTTTPSCIAEI